ncbi:MAG: hypothetical protein RBG13Loki_2225 [Promethearchaeota archaeon CR_4]|nr:MAG: hypothetical protein RBG13Loki_2225 [Candidatus Lokiarchaeota archaeon CR_4]
MDVNDEHGAKIAKISTGAILSPDAEIVAYVRKNTVRDASGVIRGYVRHGMVIGPDGEGLALYSSNTLSTYSKSTTLTFTGKTVKNVIGNVILHFNEDYISYLEELVAYIVFFSEYWREQKQTLSLTVK